ncbi:hypothetical protein GGS20DRAFT_578167 [Poronia punctata]|nr:hypothetical protein GGS20DRAFT_578167 [Poronia punctata]
MSNNNTAGLEASTSSLNSTSNDTSMPLSANPDTQASKLTSASTSLTASPAESRDPSPSRAAKAPGRTTRAPISASPSRRNSSTQDPSPSRTRSNIPTPSQTPRTQLTATAIPNLPPPSNTEATLRAPVPQKPSVGNDASKDTPRWPISPRLKSPPPSFSRPTAASSARRAEPEPPLINVQRATPSPHVEPSSQSASDIEGEEPIHSGMRTPSQTVQEVSQPNTPRPGLDAAIRKLEETATSQTGTHNKNPDTATSSALSSQNATNSESGSDSGSIKTNARRSSSNAPPPLLHSRQSSSALKFTRGQPSGESSSRNMTVETEEVKNMPQLSLIVNASGQGAAGSLRARPSTETIKPKKERKKHARKPASVTAGNASSKADIFEAKVASAVEEANSSDSDETFVYDSNPPDAERSRRYHHSRTPSAASMTSQVDRNGMRSIHAVLESGPHNAPVKKNMKFVNTYNPNSGNDAHQGEDDGRGTGRGNVGSARGTTRHHHHPGRWGRNTGSSHPSLFDNESPFPNAARSKFSSSNSNKASNPTSPRLGANRGWLSGSKRQLTLPNGYDMDETTGADDERTPLIQPATIRSPRSVRSRRMGPMRNLESQTYRRNPSFLNRFASCLVLTVMLLLVITGAIGFMFATSQPLSEVKLLKIGNVLASEQELMFDLTVRAHNPNVVVVMVDSADIEVFAKSRHAGNDSEWWRHPQGDDFTIFDDPKDDPPEVGEPSDGDSSPVMRLGNIHSFDSPLTYEGSFFQRAFTTSSGELRLARPGNTTDSGTERWERIIADEFTLVIKGVLKYTLPLSQKVRKVPISGKTLVKRNAANDPLVPQPNKRLTTAVLSTTAVGWGVGFKKKNMNTEERENKQKGR